MSTARTDAVRVRLRDEWRKRTDGLLRLLWPTLQTAVAAGVAWELARRLAHHPSPIFAPITAIVAMGFTAGRRGRQAVILVVGVALGIAVADLLLHVLGPGGIQITIAVFVAMSLALLVSREPLFVVQAGISALLLIVVDRGDAGLAPDRLGDALIGGGVALLVATVLFPIDPVAEAQRETEPVVDRVVLSLREAARSLRDADLAAAERARATRIDDHLLMETVAVAFDATRIAPRRRRDRARVRDYVTATSHLEAVVRGTRTIAGAARRLAQAGAPRRPDLGEAVARLADAVELLGRWLETGESGDRGAARVSALAAIRAAETIAPDTGIGVGTIVHLVQALGLAVLQATGLDAAQATELSRAAPRGTPPPG